MCCEIYYCGKFINFIDFLFIFFFFYGLKLGGDIAHHLDGYLAYIWGDKVEFLVSLDLSESVDEKIDIGTLILFL